MSGKRPLISRFCCLCCMLLFISIPFSAHASGEDIVPGYHFSFGAFEQDYIQSNGKEPIVWRVLDIDDDSGLVLAVSEFGLYTMKYHRNNKRTAWGNTDVRDWLNSSFLAAFSPDELQQVAVSSVSGSSDRFFLLDSDQITRYLSEPYLCYATPWAMMNGEEGQIQLKSASPGSAAVVCSILLSAKKASIT